MLVHSVRYLKDRKRHLEDLDEEDADFLQKFTFICLLNFDVYTKKLLIEKIVDSMKKPELPKNKRKR